MLCDSCGAVSALLLTTSHADQWRVLAATCMCVLVIQCYEQWVVCTCRVAAILSSIVPAKGDIIADMSSALGLPVISRIFSNCSLFHKQRRQHKPLV
jgi:hypothetical protein